MSMSFIAWMLKRHLVLGDVCVQVTNRCLYSLRYESVDNVYSLLSCLVSVKSLKMTLCAQDNIEWLAGLLSNCKNLEHVALTNSTGIDRCVEAIAQHCPKLKSCNFSRCTNVSEQSVALLCRGCVKLSKLGLNYCINVSRSLLMTIAVHCPNLQDICLEGCSRLINRDIHFLSFHCRKSFTRFTYYLFSDLSLRTFSWFRGSELKKLKMSDSHKVTNTSIVELGLACPELTNLNMSYCRNVTDCAVVAICAALPEHLQILSIKCLYETTNESIAALTSHCRQLKELHVCGNTRITSKSLRAIAALGSTLRSLSLIAMSLPDELLVGILTHCRVLEELDISYNTTLTDTALVTSLPVCRTIERFQLQCCDNLSDVSLAAITQHSLRVTELELNDCKRVSDVGVCDVLRGSSSTLTSLDLSELKLTDVALQCILKWGVRLTSLDLRGTFEIEPVRAIVATLKRLRKLKTNVELASHEVVLVNPDLLVCEE